MMHDEDVATLLEGAARAEREGDHAGAAVQLERAHQVGHDRKRVHARVHWLTARFFLRRSRLLQAAKHALLVVAAVVFVPNGSSRAGAMT
jgi:hypothetical protein